MKNNIFILFFIFVFNGCSLVPSKPPVKDRITNFKLLTKKLSTKICKKIKPNSSLYVTDFVNEANLKNSSKLGFLLSNNLKVHILQNSCTKNVSLKSLEMANSLQIGKHGSKILTRDIKKLKLKSLTDNRQVLVGTYILTQKQLIVYLKLINLKDANTIATSSTSTILTDEIKDLEGLETSNGPIIYKPFHL